MLSRLQHTPIIHQGGSFCIISKYCTCNTLTKISLKHYTVPCDIPDFTTSHSNHYHLMAQHEVLHSQRETDYNYQ